MSRFALYFSVASFKTGLRLKTSKQFLDSWIFLRVPGSIKIDHIYTYIDIPIHVCLLQLNEFIFIFKVWPISCVMGTMLGYMSGMLLTLIRIFWRNRQVQKMKIVWHLSQKSSHQPKFLVRAGQVLHWSVHVQRWINISFSWNYML